MPRINIDTEFFSDPRISALADDLNEHIFTTRGRLITLWHFCYQTRNLTLTKEQIRLGALKDIGDKLVEFLLAEKEGETYRIKGVQDRIQWLIKASEIGKKGGLNSAKSRKQKYGTSQPSSRTESSSSSKGCFDFLEAAPKPIPIPIANANAQKSAASDKIASRPAKIVFSEKGFENVKPEMITLWEKAYPAANIQTELAKAQAWLIANPNRKKRNYEQFLTNWLSRAQENPSRFNPNYTPNKIPTHNQPKIEDYQ